MTVGAVRAMARTRSGRAVSEILATVFIVAITVALAGVLFVLVSGYMATPVSSAVAVGLVAEAAHSCSQSGSTYSVFPVSVAGVTATITTTEFGMVLRMPGTSSLVALSPLGTSGEACTAVPTSPTGWVAYLVSSSPTPTASAAWAAAPTPAWLAVNDTLPVVLEAGATLMIVGGPATELAGASLTLSGMAGSMVDGSVTLSATEASSP